MGKWAPLPRAVVSRFMLPSKSEIVHCIPGRVRFRHRALRDGRGRLEIAACITAQPGVLSVRINTLLSCLTFTYEAGSAFITRSRERVRNVRSPALDLAFAVLDIPIAGLIQDLAEALRFARASLKVMRRRHDGLSLPGIVAYLGLLLLHTSLLDRLFPGHIRTLVRTARAIASITRKFAALFALELSAV